jgi:hypothetical protein
MARAAAAEAGAIREAADARFSDEEIACYALPGQRCIDQAKAPVLEIRRAARST